MAFMNQVNFKKTIFFILISTVVLCTALYTTNNSSKGKPSEDVQRLDAMLLTDLQGQEIVLNEDVKSTMNCAGISETDLRGLLSIQNVNYDKCNIENCHINTYMIESKVDHKELSFMLSSGEEGNFIEDLKVEGCNQ